MLSNKQISVREFRLSDLESVKELINKTINVCYNGFYFKEVMNYFYMYNWYGNILKVAREGYIIVVEADKKIVGTGSVIGNVILRVFVDPKYQKKGLGKMIMKELERYAVTNGVKVAQLRALTNAKEFYESLGYSTGDRSIVEVDNGRYLDYYQMEKKLK